MKLYVACSSNHLREARQAMNALHKAGHEVTGDWIEDFLSGANSEEAARFCVDAIDRAESVVFILTSTVSPGAWFEARYAVARGKTVFVVTGNVSANPPSNLIFLRLPRVFCFPNLSYLIKHLDGVEGYDHA